MSADVAELVRRAADTVFSREERAKAALEALEEGSPRFNIDADVIEEVARLAGFRRALTAAWLTDGDHRAPNLRKALAFKGDHPGDPGVTSALLELGHLGPELVASLIDEFRSQAAERPPPAPMFLAAWGIHLVKAYEAMGDGPLKAFVWAAAEEDEDHFTLITDAIALAPVDGELEELRGILQYVIEMSWSEWYTKDMPAVEVPTEPRPEPDPAADSTPRSARPTRFLLLGVLLSLVAAVLFFALR